MSAGLDTLGKNHCPQLASLTLRMNYFTTLEYEHISRFPFLSYLDVSHNLIKSLPESFGELRNLRFLNLKLNKLKTLPKTFKNLNRLATLNLTENRFIGMPAILQHMTSLQTLILDENEILEISGEFFKSWPYMISLHLKGIRLQKLPPEICFVKNLQEFYIRYRNIIRWQSHSSEQLQSFENTPCRNSQTGKIRNFRYEIQSVYFVAYINFAPFLVEVLGKSQENTGTTKIFPC